MRVHVVDPSAYTPPYDHALCRALGAAGADVTLYTSRFAHGSLAPAEHYERRELFYRAAGAVHGAGARRAVKLAEHVPAMLRYRRAARAADVVHFQWLPVQALDVHLLPDRRTLRGSRRPLVLTAHDVLPREPARGQRAAQQRLYERVDALIVHTERGRARLVTELGVQPGRVHVIPHGVLRPWEGQPPQALPAELREVDGPVVLFFGLLRPYKGLDVLLGAWRELHGAELWIVGMPRMDLGALHAAAPAGVRWLERFVSDGELLALMRRASLVVLPYREIEQSGVAFTAIGAGVPLLLSDVGGFPELAASGVARTFRTGDPASLHAALTELLASPAELVALAARASAAAAQDYSWARIADQTLALYAQVLGR
ncbi:MAG TPA: glycosyltransferase family 4 protein [Solirubrobacteraceae bacterium]|nr:glycosyltransferase family 4 protein [Solirubrobacteraceae bacterium]